MTKQLHTPGPWIIQLDHDGNFQKSPMIISQKPLPGHGSMVCVMGGGIVLAANAIANARLIAAAPDLLEACKRVLGEHNNGFCELPLGAKKQLEYVVQKAEGDA